MKKTIFIFFIVIRSFGEAHSQSVDSLFSLARQEAFDKKDYQKAVELCKKIQQPKNIEVGLFLGKIYTWMDSLSLARKQFVQLLKLDSLNIDVAQAYIDLEYWHNNNIKALYLCENFMVIYPSNQGFLIRKIKILIELGMYKEAKLLLKDLPTVPEAQTLKNKIETKPLKNKLLVSYEHWFFYRNQKEGFSQNPWQIRTLSYSRSTNQGTFLIRLQNATRFGNTGSQIEIEGYPSIRKGLNAYLNVGFSKQYPVFPHYRFGSTIYANLPHKYEVEAGFRLLKFQENIWIYTAALGKYIGNYFFNLRTYLVPDIHSLSPSFRLTTNYYFGKNNDYLSCYVGTGLFSINNPFLFDTSNVSSSIVGLLFSKKIYTRHGLKTDFSVMKQASQTGIQTSFEIAYSVSF